MKISFTPQATMKPDDVIRYRFDAGDKITVQMNGKQDTFDFEGVPEGQLNVQTVQTHLVDISTDSPIVSAEKKDGELYVTLLYRIPHGVDPEIVKSDWIDPKDYKPFWEVSSNAKDE